MPSRLLPLCLLHHNNKMDFLLSESDCVCAHIFLMNWAEKNGEKMIKLIADMLQFVIVCVLSVLRVLSVLLCALGLILCVLSLLLCVFSVCYCVCSQFPELASWRGKVFLPDSRQQLWHVSQGCTQTGESSGMSMTCISEMLTNRWEFWYVYDMYLRDAHKQMRVLVYLWHVSQRCIQTEELSPVKYMYFLSET